jgi:ribose transport system substrate-binding protein
MREDDRDEQTKILESVLRQRIDGVILAPFDNKTFVPLVERAAADGTSTVVVDSALDSSRILSFIATDNEKAGALAGDRMAEVLGGRGKVVILRYQEGSASTREREEGFRKRAGRYPEMKIVLSEDFAGATRASAKIASETLLARHQQDLAGVFTPNESSTAGMVMALSARSSASEPVAHVGFDTSDLYFDMLRTNKLKGLVAQDPFRMGELGVKAIADHARGKSVPRRIDTGAKMITSANMDLPEIVELLKNNGARK